MTREDLRLIERLRQWRNFPQRDLTITAAVGNVSQDYKQRARNLGSLGAAWSALLPAELLPRTELVGLARGVLTVRCEDASTRFEVDRWLRGGGEISLIKRAAARLTRVRLAR